MDDVEVETSQEPYGAKLIALRKELATARAERDSLAAQLAETIERCAKVCETHVAYYIGHVPERLVPSDTGERYGQLFAQAIRALKTDTPG